MFQEIYIVDDDIQMARMLSVAIEASGFKTHVFSDAMDFLAIPTAEQDAILLDLNMPDMDGIEVIRALAEKKCKSGLILMSGNDTGVLHSAEKLARAHSLNVIISLCKPIQVGMLQLLLGGSADKRFEYRAEGDKNSTSFSVSELQKSVANKQLVLHYQPQLDLKTNTLMGAEALVRWQHPEIGLILPDEFIGVAEKNGIIDNITSWVIATAIEQSSYCKRSGITPRVSVNISPQNITSLSLPDQLTSMLSNNKLDSSVLALEITETSLMGELITSLDILTRLRMKGFDLSIDDFGTGHSSLQHLHRVPFTELKIDKSFVTSMDIDDEAYAIVKTCVMLGHELNMKVTAEGVESESVYEMLVDLGCDAAQGFYIAHPMSSEKLIEWALAPRPPVQFPQRASSPRGTRGGRT